jgi:hypothetical protein
MSIAYIRVYEELASSAITLKIKRVSLREVYYIYIASSRAANVRAGVEGVVKCGTNWRLPLALNGACH